MKITICGSSKFRYEMVENMEKLKKLGHDVIVHEHYIKSVNGEMPELMERVEREHAVLKREQNYIKWYHNAIKNSDAILVLNFEKNGIENYVGGNTLMEMGFAHVNDKKIFLYNPIPADVSYVDEIEAMADIIINGDLNLIN
ncbi:MAG: hypothetical protein COX30_04105 [Candidatus Moranbacteria bacterium CG23_combo_of_CG06-09_8_20_14_all_39_10]|nr:MAG: hypothetical protein COX30_04105 [Candidatus Moranbacteria bacterium CG23_combo_of_CG06-09_8_20_14_all_39_10]